MVDDIQQGGSMKKAVSLFVVGMALFFNANMVRRRGDSSLINSTVIRQTGAKQNGGLKFFYKGVKSPVDYMLKFGDTYLIR